MKLPFALSLALLLTLQAGYSAAGAQQTSKSSPQITAQSAKKLRPIPFHGTLAAVNPAARTLTVGKRTFLLTTDTKYYKQDKNTPGTMKDAVIGTRVTGSYVESSEGKLLARSLYFKGPGPTSASKKSIESAPSRE